MKIAIFSDTYLPEKNGVVTSIKNFSQILASRGHEILIVAPRYENYRDRKQKRISVLRYPAFSFASNKSTKVALPKTIDLLNRLRQFEPDLIHIQTPASLGIAGILMSKVLKVPNVQTYHTYLPELAVYFDVAKVFGLEKIPEIVSESKLMRRVLRSDFYELIKRVRKKKLLGDFIGFRELKKEPNYELTVKVLWAYTRWVYNRADLILTPSEVLKNELKKHHLKPPVKAQTNGINYDEFEKKQDYRLKNKIIYMGRLGYEKRVDVVIRAFAELKKYLSKIQLWLYGLGPAEESLKKLAKELGVSDDVTFKGHYEIENLRSTIKNFDLFVTASPMETQGLVILEAMSAGLPVVGVRVLAIPEVVKNRINGFLVRRDDYRTMALRIKEVLESEPMRKKMGQESLRIAREHNITKAADLLEKHYQMLMNN